jgi:hypothetical protein
MHRILVYTTLVSIVRAEPAYVERHIIIVLHGPHSDAFIVILQIKDGILRIKDAVGKFYNYFYIR